MQCQLCEKSLNQLSKWLSISLSFTFVACFLLAVACQSAKAQQVKEFTKDQLENAFTTYIANKTPPTRGDFETQEDYQNRLPKPVDQNKIYVFPDLNLPLGMHKNYKYDMDNQRLTIFAGYRYSYLDYRTKGITQKTDFIGDGLPIKIYTSAHHLGSYEGQNAYGAKTTVTSNSYYDFILNIDNYKNIPDIIVEKKVIENEFKAKTDEEIQQEMQQVRLSFNNPNYANDHANAEVEKFENYNNISLFHFSMNISTNKAKELTEQGVETVLFVHMHSYQESTSFCDGGHTATIKDPHDYGWTEYIINATLVKIVVRNSKTKEVLAQYDIPDKNKNPPIDTEKQPWD